MTAGGTPRLFLLAAFERRRKAAAGRGEKTAVKMLRKRSPVRRNMRNARGGHAVPQEESIGKRFVERQVRQMRGLAPGDETPAGRQMLTCRKMRWVVPPCETNSRRFP